MHKLSVKLKALCKELTVELLSQQIETITTEEKRILNLKENQALIRRVYLCGDGERWVYARVAVPMETYLRYKEELDKLGTGLLGENFLFNKPDVKRSEFYQLVSGNYKDTTRYSIFTLEGKFQLLVTESFLRDFDQEITKQPTPTKVPSLKPKL